MSLAADTLTRTPTPATHEFLDMSAPDAAAAWDDLLSLQVELSFPHELAFFIASGRLSSAASILDVGCGNGDYLARLAPFFPHIRGIGIDCASQMIAAAQRWSGPCLSFLTSDFFSFRPLARYDVALMRLLIQHLSDFPSVLRHAGDCLVSGGRLFLIEPDLENTATSPGLPAFEGMIREHELATKRNDRLRTRIADIPSIVRQTGDWEVVTDLRLGVPLVGPFAGGKVARMYYRWIELCERSDTFRFEFQSVRKEIAEWSGLPNSFARFGIRIFELRHA